MQMKDKRTSELRALLDLEAEAMSECWAVQAVERGTADAIVLIYN